MRGLLGYGQLNFDALHSFAKEKIALAPNNESAWNYLRGVLNYTKTPYSSLRQFVEPYTVAHPAEPNTNVIDLDNPRPAPGADLPCRMAVEFLADIYEQEGGDDVPKAIEVGRSVTRSRC